MNGNSIIQFANQMSFDVAPTAHTKEQAWGDSLLYRSGAFPEYRPDELFSKKGDKIYKKMMIDEQCKSVVRFRRDATTGREWFFNLPETDELSDSEKQMRVDLFYEIIEQMPGTLKPKLDGIMSAMQHGYSLTEKVFRQIEFEKKTWWGLKNLRTKDFSSFYFYLDEYGEMTKFEQLVDGMTQVLDIRDFIHHVQNSDVHEYYGQSELREAYRSYYSKDICIRFHNMYLERTAGGFIWVQPSDKKILNVNSAEYNSLQTALQKIRNNTVMILPSGYTLNIQHPLDTQAFERAISMHDKGIAKSLLMPNLLGLSEQGNTGSYSQSKTQLEAFLWMLESERKSLEETLNEQLFKQLGLINFGDNFYPTFEFKNLSFEQIKDLILTWQGLVGVRAVHNTPEDEAYIRNLLGFPELSEEYINGNESDEDEQDIGGASEIPEDDIDGNNDSGGGDSIGDGGDNNGRPDKSSQNNRTLDETVMGDPITINNQRFTKAVRRVDFANIDRSSTAIEFVAVDALGNAVADMTDSMIKILLEIDIDNPDFKKINALKPNSSDKKEINKVITKTLKDTWGLGKIHAENEVKMALGPKKTLLKRLNFVALEEIAAEYFRTKSFGIAGDLSDKVTAVIRQSILNGIKNQKSIEQIRDDIYRKLGKDGMLPADRFPEEYLIDAFEDFNPEHRLNTIIRTNSFEAINEGRKAYFQDPALGGFVEAYEYSAILDGRTTAICSSLGNPDNPQTHAVGNPVWDSITPPNHFNCRSILVPLIRGDEWQESGPPQVQPAEGFG
jgi:SPP1 gp7 family putative phage head morphogenesis protein